MTASTIILDPDRLLPKVDDATVVDTVAGYAPACLQIRAALSRKEPVTLYVTNRSAAAWLRQALGHHGEDRLRITTVTPSSILSEQWGLVIPISVTDSDIRQSRLLDEDIIPREGQGFTEVLLEHFYGDGYTFAKFHPSRLCEILNQYDPLRRQDAAGRQLVTRALQEKIDQWEQAASQDVIKKLIRRLRDEPAQLRRDLVNYKILRDYPPSIGQKVLGEAWQVFRKATIDTADLTGSPKDLDSVTNEVRFYLTSIQQDVQTPTDLVRLLDQVSGCLYAEFAFVESVLNSHLDWLSSELLRRVEVAFRPIRTQVSRSLAQLRNLVRPAYPVAPEADWSVARWLDWVSSVYMPYYSWMEAAGQSDDTVRDYAATFADWYYDNFNVLKNSQQDKFAFTALYRNRSRITKPETVSLILLVDNFNYVHFPELCRQFSRHDFELQASEPVLSLIPTATEVAKAALIASSGDQVDLPSESYPGLVKTEWGAILKDRTAQYLPYIGDLQNLKSLDHAVYFLNYLTIDKALHEDAKIVGRGHSDIVRDHLATLASAVAEFAGRFQIQDRIVVYTISDHGSTRIARTTVNVLDQDFFKKLALEKHRRFVALTDDAFANLPQVAQAQCYLLDRAKFKTNHNYLAARSYYRFLETSDTYYVHGGLTPEEVVVPFARFEVAPVKPNAPTLRLLKTEYRYAKRSPVEIEIGNPNPYPLQSISVRLVDQDSEEVELEVLRANTADSLGPPTLFRKVPGEGNARTITVRVRFECQGREFSPADTQFDITLKSLMEVTDDFEL